MGTLRYCFNAAVALSKSCHRSSLPRKNFGQRFNFVRNYGSTYEGDGKTHAVLLNDETDSLMISSYSTVGFTLNNGITLVGPIAIFPNCVLSWNVGDLHHINEESLSLFLKIEPKLDILILGIPEYKKRDRKVLLGLANLIREYKIPVEIMPVEIAGPTFNFLHAERRFVAAGMIPPIDVDGDSATAMESPWKVGYVEGK
ncbi:NADH dehydrogenase [ubiquinone] 1 alpha subcomplex assembly factor 3 [Thrips palmi]|uniref:NADH dehydrogenase [ubiquinone] 1 alpha subcomplex assembly factor 3 n=1 Tax=Thrips palmi TaxID=161013 RepID=A0A6P8ZIX8_THRPL|nr:NADH dehydrogenase [ubiquinone] 1 alpha subcomplex assembly factor 3 [Thrips palmi]